MAVVTFKATSRKLPEGLMVESDVRGFKMILDEPEDLGGTNKGMNPVEALLCALGSCQSIVAAVFAKQQGINLKEFWVELEGDLDTDGFMGKSNVRPGFQEIRFKMHIKSDSPEDKVKEFAKFIEKRCPVGDTLTQGVKLVSSGVVVE
ncbi:OsmC family protein [Calorimonas adulescens]|jgi:OsmC-like protein.|uniref:OsmC family protein n=1 Tax=Calorimonas adulescens TaxID=2606906 RepID=A0A5D8Q9T4_9THEO|nr:OsmC family protein [Calorimonas adulescens]TZE81137.1 OsmC family protein [Calorimonas adulescens]